MTMQGTEPGAELIRTMVAAMVDSPDAIFIDHEFEGDVCQLKVRVAAEDLGKLIGKQGRTARSMRTILGAAGMKRGQRYSLDIERVGPRLPSGAASYIAPGSGGEKAIHDPIA